MSVKEIGVYERDKRLLRMAMNSTQEITAGWLGLGAPCEQKERKNNLMLHIFQRQTDRNRRGPECKVQERTVLKILTG